MVTPMAVSAPTAAVAPAAAPAAPPVTTKPVVAAPPLVTAPLATAPEVTVPPVVTPVLIAVGFKPINGVVFADMIVVVAAVPAAIVGVMESAALISSVENAKCLYLLILYSNDVILNYRNSNIQRLCRILSYLEH